MDMLNNHEQIDYDYGQYYKVHYFTHPFPENYVDFHWHNSLEILYYKNINGCIIQNNQEYSIQKNDIMAISSGDVHAIKCDASTEQSGVLVVMISYDYLNLYIPQYSHYTISYPKQDEYLQDIMDEYIKAWLIRETDDLFQLSTLELLNRIISYIFHHYAKHKNLSENNISEELPQNLRKILMYINSNLKDIKKVDDLTEVFFYSRVHISRLFKQHLNTTFHLYITNERLIRAQYYLINTSMTLQEISEKVGFSDVRTFQNAFTKRYNISPKEYRKNY